MSLIVGVLAITAALANPIQVYRMRRRILQYINRISGALVLLVGLYVGYYGVYEVRIFSDNANPDDPVIAAAARVQSTLASWVHRHGDFSVALGVGGASAGRVRVDLA